MDGGPVWWLPDLELARRALVNHLNRNADHYGQASVLVTIGAGDVFRLGEELLVAPLDASEAG